MNTFKLLSISLSAIYAALSTHAQGTFQNLNFESANPSGYPPNSDLSIASGLPGWSGFYGGTQTSTLSYDGISTGGALISLVDDSVVFDAFDPIQGSYSVYLFGGGNNPLLSATISQAGIVPAGTMSLVFDAKVSGSPFIVTLGGVTISMTAQQTFPTYTVYSGSIPSSFDGQFETLRFTEPPATGTQPSMFELDDITFSPNTVPEPNTLALLVMGGVALAFRRWRAKGS
jgi:hypothetical protein